MKKIVRIIARLNIGGPAVHIANLCDLSKSGYETTLIYGSTGPGEGDMSYLLKDKKVRTVFIPELGREISLLKDIKTLWKIFRIIRKERPDIVHTHTAKAGMLGRLAACLAGAGQVYHTFHGHVFHGYFGKMKTWLFIMIERFLVHVSDRIIVLSAHQQREIGRILRAPVEKFTIIPLGFDLSRFGARNKDFLAGYQVKTGCIAIGIIGRLTSIKNHSLFLSALEQIRKRDMGIDAFIIGDGELREELAAQAENLGIARNVHFTGWIEDLAPVYAALDYLFLTSKNEGTPVAVIEAMAAGVVVVSTAVGGVPDIVADGENGFLVKSQSPLDFANRFLEAHGLSAEEKDSVRARARRTADRFTIKRLLGDIDALYRLEN